MQQDATHASVCLKTNPERSRKLRIRVTWLPAIGIHHTTEFGFVIVEKSISTTCRFRVISLRVWIPAFAHCCPGKISSEKYRLNSSLC